MLVLKNTRFVGRSTYSGEYYYDASAKGKRTKLEARTETVRMGLLHSAPATGWAEGVIS